MTALNKIIRKKQLSIFIKYLYYVFTQNTAVIVSF